MLPDGQVVNGKTVTSAPLAFVVVGGRALKAGPETEADVNGLVGPRREVKGTEVFLGEVVPAVVGAGGEEAVVDDVLRSSTPRVDLEHAVVVKSAPHRGARSTSALDGSELRTSDEAPAGLVASDLNDGKVIPHIADNKAGSVRASEGTESQMTEEFDAHERPVGTGQVNVVEDHRIVPVLSVAGPRVS